MNKSELITAMADKSGLSKKVNESALNAFMEIVQEKLVEGDKIQLVGFGTLETAVRAEREGRNPKTQVPITIPATKVVKFKAGKSLKEILNK